MIGGRVTKIGCEILEPHTSFAEESGFLGCYAASNCENPRD